MAKRWMAGVIMAVGMMAATPAWAQPYPPPSMPAPPDGSSPFAGPPMMPMPQPGGLPARAPGEDCADADAFGDPGRGTQISAEYLLWWIRKSHIPALVTTGSVNDPVPGALGQPSTVLVFGNSIDHEERSGARLTIRHWFDEDHYCGVEASGLILTGDSRGYSSTSSAGAGSVFLARPFFNAAAGVEDADPVVVPNLMAGTIDASLSSTLTSAEVNLLLSYFHGPVSGWHFNLLAGPRFMTLYEKLLITEVNTSAVDGTSNFLSDAFTAHNQFYGGQVGFTAEWHPCPIHVNVRGKLGFGTNYESVRIQGAEVIGDAGVPFQGNAGLLAQASNSGTFKRYEFAFVPEVGVNLGWQIKPNWYCFIDYSLIYWSEVARPGDQIDRTISTQAVNAPTQMGPPRPFFKFNGTDFYAHGVSFGLQYSF